MSQELLDKINSRGYWRVVIRPTEYREENISLGEIRKTLDSTVLHLRGWDYPHIDRSNTTNGQNYVQSYADFLGNIEFWRFYQSGQFINRFAMREDWHEVSSIFGTGKPLPFKSLDIIETLYNVTEIVEFATRLAVKGIYGKNIKIEISLCDTNDRALASIYSHRWLSRDYVCKIPEIKWEKLILTEELISNSAEISMNATLYIFERFNWNTSADIFKDDQQKLLSGRL